jgi:FkbM family methyltransferase
VLEKIVRRAKRIAFAPRISVAPHPELTRLGTAYGGWSFLDLPSLRSATIVSAGLGEDASFDVEFAKKYGAKVVVVDPTPRAIEHFRKMQSRLGQAATSRYAASGDQPVEAYDMSGLTGANFELVPKALWNASGTVKFFTPSNPSSVSHSITNFKRDYSDSTPYIEVPSTTLADILNDRGIAQLELLKLDIEGAAVEVLSHMISAGIYPKQVLVEFDELSVPSRRTRERVEAMHGLLRQNGYDCLCFDGRTDFTFARMGSL